MPTQSDVLRERVKIQDAMLTRAAESSLRAFVEQAWPIFEPEAAFVPNWHIDLVCEYLEAVTDGECRRLLINVPPRSMKSYLVSVMWPAWEWIRRPGGRWICASFADTLAIKHSVDRRAIVQSPWYQERWGDRVRLTDDQNVKGEFQNTARGVMIATSVGGSVTGKGANRIIADDLHNPQQAESDTQRENAVTFFRTTLSTRLNDKKADAFVVVMQRLHERDLAAFCLDMGYTQVCLPAEAETRTVHVFPRSQKTYVREPGDLLWPAREGAAELELQKRMLGSSAYAGQYQQRPAPAGGAIFQREWLQFYDELPTLAQLTTSWDMSFKNKPDNDYVVGLVGGRSGANRYIIDRVKGQWSFTETCRQVKQLAARYPAAHTHLIEDTANGPAITDTLKQQLPGIIAVQPDGGKLARAQAVSPMVESGNVFLPNPRPHGRLIPEREWVEDFVHQLIMFPHGAHDDDVDAFTQLLIRIRKPPVSCVW